MDKHTSVTFAPNVEYTKKQTAHVTTAIQSTQTPNLVSDLSKEGCSSITSSGGDASSSVKGQQTNSAVCTPQESDHFKSIPLNSATNSDSPAIQKSVLYMPEAVTSMTKAAEKSCKHYVIALRPWSFTASLTPVGLGSILAYKVLGSFNVWIFLATCLTALSVHAAGNLVNSYFDFVKGVDSKKSDDRTLVDNILTPNDVATMGAIFYFIGCLSFALCVHLSTARMEHLAFIYFGGLSGSFLYTGGMGLKYIALGDLAIFLTFGPITVLFAYMGQGGSFSWMPILYTIPLALNIEAILHANNTRDMDTDKAAGIITVAILVGKTGSYILFTFLLFVPYIVFLVFTMNCSRWFLLPAVTILIAFKIEREFRSDNLKNLPKMMAKLNLQLGLLYILACALSDRLHMPGLV